MKKLFLFLLILIFLISLVSADVCTPDSGYDYCGEEIYTYGQATANPEVQISNVQGIRKGGYYVGNALIKFKFEGDKYYVYENAGSWSNLWDIAKCNSIGCSLGGYGVTTAKDGIWFLVLDPGDQYTDCPIFVAWDKDTAPNGDWAWQTTGYGWTGTGNCFNIKSVECYDNSDCSSGEICDKSGDWTTWSCITDPCKYVTCEDKCQNSIKYYYGICEDGECRYLERTCTYGCIGKLCAEDPCKGVICDDKCENSIWYHDGSCVNGACVYASQDTCQYGCQDEPIIGESMCRDESCVGIVCEDYCSSNSLFYDGKCIGGECKQFQEKEYAEECAVEPWYKNTWVWVGSISFIIVSVFGIMYWWRR